MPSGEFVCVTTTHIYDNLRLQTLVCNLVIDLNLCLTGKRTRKNVFSVFTDKGGVFNKAVLIVVDIVVNK